jgi:hypothetical protein
LLVAPVPLETDSIHATDHPTERKAYAITLSLTCSGKASGPDYLRRFALEQVVATNSAAVGSNAWLIAIEDE